MLTKPVLGVFILYFPLHMQMGWVLDAQAFQRSWALTAFGIPALAAPPRSEDLG